MYLNFHTIYEHLYHKFDHELLCILLSVIRGILVERVLYFTFCMHVSLPSPRIL